jgi:hypothetical protein
MVLLDEPALGDLVLVGLEWDDLVLDDVARGDDATLGGPNLVLGRDLGLEYSMAWRALGLGRFSEDPNLGSGLLEELALDDLVLVGVWWDDFVLNDVARGVDATLGGPTLDPGRVFESSLLLSLLFPLGLSSTSPLPLELRLGFL